MRYYEFISEAPLSGYTPMGDFDKPGPFRGVDKKLVPHPVNQLKTAKFFEKTPYDFRLFFSNIPGTGKYSEYGPMRPQVIQDIFGEQAKEILDGSQDAITIVFVGNKGDSKKPLTPWMMSHRFGHAIQAGVRMSSNTGWNAWTEAEKHFFTNINELLSEYYMKNGKTLSGYDSTLAPVYSALFNTIGTQHSSRSNQINRPYEFLYEIFAQYLGTGKVTFNPIPANLGYGRKNWGNSSRYLTVKSEYRDEGERASIANRLANDMEILFDDVLSASVGKIFVM